MLYLLLFFLCVLAAYIKKKSPFLYYVDIAILVIILCFSYMNGHDWKNYEQIWNGTFDVNETHLSNAFVYIFIMKLFKLITNDFWIFFAIVKIVFLKALYDFFKTYAQKPWVAIGLSFVTCTLIFFIEGTFRFMISLIFFLYAIQEYYKKRYIRFSILSLLSIGCHLTFVFVISVWLTKPIAKYFVKIHPAFLLLLYFAVYYVSIQSSSYLPFLNLLANNGDMANYLKSYGDVIEMSEGSFWGVISRFFFLSICVYMKKWICEKYKEEGACIVYFACLNAYLGLFLGSIPSAHRLNYLNSYYMIIILYCFLDCQYASLNSLNSSVMRLLKVMTVCLVCFLIFKNTNNYIYKPYTNSIPYIISGHPSFSYRDTYNYKNFK